MEWMRILAIVNVRDIWLSQNCNGQPQLVYITAAATDDWFVTTRNDYPFQSDARGKNHNGFETVL